MPSFATHFACRSLQIRYNADEIYTSIGAVLIAVNPFKRLTLYSDETLRSYKAVGEQRRDDDTRLQPHIFQVRLREHSCFHKCFQTPHVNTYIS